MSNLQLKHWLFGKMSSKNDDKMMIQSMQQGKLIAQLTHSTIIPAVVVVIMKKHNLNQLLISSWNCQITYKMRLGQKLNEWAEICDRFWQNIDYNCVRRATSLVTYNASNWQSSPPEQGAARCCLVLSQTRHNSINMTLQLSLPLPLPLLQLSNSGYGEGFEMRFGELTVWPLAGSCRAQTLAFAR